MKTFECCFVLADGYTKLYSFDMCCVFAAHYAGVGDPLTLRRCRMLLALRINVLVKGYRLVRVCIASIILKCKTVGDCKLPIPSCVILHYSGIRVETLTQAVEALNGQDKPVF